MENKIISHQSSKHNLKEGRNEEGRKTRLVCDDLHGLFHEHKLPVRQVTVKNPFNQQLLQLTGHVLHAERRAKRFPFILLSITVKSPLSFSKVGLRRGEAALGRPAR